MKQPLVFLGLAGVSLVCANTTWAQQTEAAAEMIEVAVTVDDLPLHGPLPKGVTRHGLTQKMLKTLQQYKVPEVYGFINAGKIKDDESLASVLKLWTDSGYPLGNHTLNHKNINKVSIEEFENEINENEDTLRKWVSHNRWRYFRYPFLIEGADLARRNAIRQHLQTRGYTIAQVTIDFEDWSWNQPYARCLDGNKPEDVAWLKSSFVENAVYKLRQAKAISDFLYKRPVKHVLLLHIGAIEAEVLDSLLQAYKKRRVKFIPLSEAMRDEIYAFDPGQLSNRGVEFTFQVMKSRGLKLHDIGWAENEIYPAEKLEGICR